MVVIIVVIIIIMVGTVIMNNCDDDKNEDSDNSNCSDIILSVSLTRAVLIVVNHCCYITFPISIIWLLSFLPTISHIHIYAILNS